MKAKKTLWGVLTLRILDALENVGPMTASDMKDHLHLDDNPGDSVLHRLSHATKTMPKRIYIIDWRCEQDGQRDYPRPVYAFGSKPDKPRPPIKRRSAVVREYMQRVQRKAQCIVPGVNQRDARKVVARMGRDAYAGVRA